MGALNGAMGWIVAVWLLLAIGAASGGGGPYAPYACMGCAVLTVCAWAMIHIAILKAKAQGEGG